MTNKTLGILIERANLNTPPSAIKALKGSWQIIQWCPDLVIREWINIGVGFQHDDKQYFQFLENFQNIEFIYGNQIKEFLSKIIQMTKTLFDDRCFDFSSQIQLIEVGFQKADTVEEALQDSFNRVVTMGKIAWT